MNKPIRQQLLEQGINLTVGQRDKVYGDPKLNMQRYATLLSGYLGHPVSLVDASMFMVLAKISRVPASVNHEDNYVDGAVYFAIAGELAARSKTESNDESNALNRPRSVRAIQVRRTHSKAELDAHSVNENARRVHGRRGSHRD